MVWILEFYKPVHAKMGGETHETVWRCRRCKEIGGIILNKVPLSYEAKTVNLMTWWERTIILSTKGGAAKRFRNHWYKQETF